jgi:hypothetical protein
VSKPIQKTSAPVEQWATVSVGRWRDNSELGKGKAARFVKAVRHDTDHELRARVQVLIGGPCLNKHCKRCKKAPPPGPCECTKVAALKPENRPDRFRCDTHGVSAREGVRP